MKEPSSPRLLRPQRPRLRRRSSSLPGGDFGNHAKVVTYDPIISNAYLGDDLCPKDNVFRPQGLQHEKEFQPEVDRLDNDLYSLVIGPFPNPEYQSATDVLKVFRRGFGDQTYYNCFITSLSYR